MASNVDCDDLNRVLSYVIVVDSINGIKNLLY